jgi:hypothetical protein
LKPWLSGRRYGGLLRFGWLARQLTEAFPWDTAPQISHPWWRSRLGCDPWASGTGRPRSAQRDMLTAHYNEVRAHVSLRKERPAHARSSGLETLLRIRSGQHLIGSVRRDCTDHLVGFNASTFDESLRNTKAATNQEVQTSTRMAWISCSAHLVNAASVSSSQRLYF